MGPFGQQFEKVLPISGTRSITWWHKMSSKYIFCSIVWALFNFRLYRCIFEDASTVVSFHKAFQKPLSISCFSPYSILYPALPSPSPLNSSPLVPFTSLLILCCCGNLAIRSNDQWNGVGRPNGCGLFWGYVTP